MHKLTKDEIGKLIDQTGHALSVDDLDLIAEFNELAGKVSGVTKSESRLLSQPFELCGIAFYPLTVAKSLWYAERCVDWEIEGSQQEALLFWLLTLPNITGELDKYTCRKLADKAIRKLSRRLHCSPQEMSDVYAKCVGINGSDGEGEASYGGLIECLLREYGGEPDRWLYETPLPMIETLMNNYAARINAEQEASARSLSHSGRAVAPMASARLIALRDMRLKRNEIRELWSKDDG